MKSIGTAALALALLACGPQENTVNDTAGFAIGEVKIEEIDGNAHAVWVSVGVSEPARVRVEFSQLGEPALVTEWREEALRHRVPVVGLLGAADSTVVIHAETAGGEWISEPVTFTTGEPADFRRPTVSGDSLARSPNGVMYLMDQTDRRTADGASGPTRFVGVDQLGRLIWDHNSGDDSQGHAPFIEVLDNGNFFYRTATGGVEMTPWGEEVSSFDLGEDLHHDAARLPSGNWVVMTHTYDTLESEEFGDFTLMGDGLVEVDPDGTEVWRWELRDHLDWEATQTEFNTPSEGLRRSDWTHANSVQYVEEEDGFLMSLRHLSQVIFIDRSSGEILWTLGERGDFELEKGIWFSGQHDAQLLSSNEILLYDNSLNGSLPESRGLRLALDFEEMKAEISEEFNAGVAAYSMGSIRPLENGGILLSSGGHRTDGVPSRVLEFKAEGEEVLRLEQALMKQLNYRTGAFYYAEPL